MDIKVPPLNVSPLIKGTRWSLLVLGIFYGSWRLRVLRERELPIREGFRKKHAEEARRKEEERHRRLIEEQNQDWGKLLLGN